MRKKNTFISLILVVMLIVPYVQVKANEKITVGTGQKYSKVEPQKLPKTYSGQDSDQYIPKDVKEKLQILENSSVLQPLTESKYEIALAYSDGSYEFVEATDNLEEAIDKSNNIGLGKKSGQAAVGVVINNDGNIVYSPNGVGRVRKYIGGAFDSTSSNNSYVYPNSSLTDKTEYTYINHKYVEDVGLISQVGSSSQIQFGSSIGWVRGANNTGNYDLVVTPITQYRNPSHYYVSGGVLYHFISNNIEATSTSGSTVTLGPAPKELVQGKKYLSFDGVYFYEITTNGQAYTNLVTDLRNGTSRSRAVNGNNPYYNYYNYLPFRTQSEYTAQELNTFIENNTKDKPKSKLKGIGQALKESEEKYGVNAILTLGVAINESGWGMSKIAQEKNNLFGIKAYDSDPNGSSTTFSTPGESIIGFAKHYISKGYCDPNDWRGFGSILGNKETGANVKYASDPYWGEKASGLAFRIDYELAGKKINNLRDYNNYQLLMATGPNTVYNASGEVLNRIGDSKVTSTGTLKKGTIMPLSSLEVVEGSRGKEYKINPDRKDIISFVNITGDYDFNVKGYLSINNTKMINKAKANSTIYLKEDVNGDGKVDVQDVTMVANLYNITSKDSKYNKKLDLNNDGIIDLFDLVIVSKKM